MASFPGFLGRLHPRLHSRADWRIHLALSPSPRWWLGDSGGQKTVESRNPPPIVRGQSEVTQTRPGDQISTVSLTEGDFLSLGMLACDGDNHPYFRGVLQSPLEHRLPLSMRPLSLFSLLSSPYLPYPSLFFPFIP